MSLARRHAYLRALGITPWVDRSRVVAINAPPSVHVLVQWQTDELRMVASHPAGELLLNLLKALRLQPTEYAVEQLRDTAQLDGTLQASRSDYTLAFVGQTFDDSRVFGLPTVEQMLADRAHKQAAWAKLKPWVGKLSAGQKTSD